MPGFGDWLREKARSLQLLFREMRFAGDRGGWLGKSSEMERGAGKNFRTENEQEGVIGSFTCFAVLCGCYIQDTIETK